MFETKSEVKTLNARIIEQGVMQRCAGKENGIFMEWLGHGDINTVLICAHLCPGHSGHIEKTNLQPTNRLPPDFALRYKNGAGYGNLRHVTRNVNNDMELYLFRQFSPLIPPLI